MNTLVSEIDLTRRIKKEKNHAKIIPRLIFIKLLYGEKSKVQASKDVSVAKRVGTNPAMMALYRGTQGVSSRDSQMIRRENLRHCFKQRIPGILAIS